ncbi:MAG: TRAP transporter small permease subunit [Pseudomonadota bacterium]
MIALSSKSAALRFHNLLLLIARRLTFASGVVLLGVVAVTCLSILGRSLSGFLTSPFADTNFPTVANTLLALGIGPIRGDYELVEAGVAFCIAAFLPYCILTQSHAIVSVVTERLRPATQQALKLLADLLLAIGFTIIAIQLVSGTISKFLAGQTTFLLELPVWTAYALCSAGLMTSAICAWWLVIARLLETFGHDPIMADFREVDT